MPTTEEDGLAAVGLENREADAEEEEEVDLSITFPAPLLYKLNVLFNGKPFLIPLYKDLTSIVPTQAMHAGPKFMFGPRRYSLVLILHT